ncbi:MAG: hypothetical protein JWP85_891 [Rhodoglobus sp.]|nr:hypothetical protein [Rhodoglobus sp.]
MLYVTMYYIADGVERGQLMEVYPRHRAYLDEFARGGELESIGAFLDVSAPGSPGSMAVFRSREAAERFIAVDPFVTEGLVGRHEVREWDPLTYPPGADSAAN